MRIPAFGASLTVKPVASNLKDLDQDTMMELALLADHKAELNDRVGKIRDEKDPLSLSVDVAPAKTTGSIQSQVNGHKTLTREPGQDLAAFVGQLIDEAVKMTKKLVSPAEKNQNVLNRIDGFLNTNGPIFAFGAGNIDFVRQEQGRWAHEVGFECESSKGAVFNIGGQEYKVSKTVRGRETSYDFQSLNGDNANLSISLDRAQQATRFKYEDQIDPYFDMAKLQESDQQDDKIKLSMYITRTKNAIKTIEGLGVFNEK